MYTKKGIIDRIEENYAIIHLEDGQKLMWEQDNLPVNLSEGSAVYVEIKDSKMAQKGNKELAENILREIFNPALKTE